MSDTNDSSAPPAPTSLPRERRSSRSFLPRFRLRSLFVFALLVSFLFGWFGRNYVRIRREDAAIETLKQAGATIYIETGDGWDYHPATPFFPEDPGWELVPSLASRLIGWSGDAPVRRVEITSDSSDADGLGRALAALGAFPEIESLGLAGPLVDDESLKALSNLPNVNSLALARTSVTAGGLSGIAFPQRIRILVLSRPQDGAGLLAGASSLTELRWLQVIDADMTRTEMARIAALPKLETLKLLYVTPSEEDVFAPLANAKGLTELTIEASYFEDPDVAAIASLPHLDRLWIDGNVVTDAGLAKLDSLKTLRALGITEPVTESAVRTFAEGHPDVIVTYRTLGSARHFKGSEELAPAAARTFFEGEAIEEVDRTP